MNVIKLNLSNTADYTVRIPYKCRFGIVEKLFENCSKTEIVLKAVGDKEMIPCCFSTIINTILEYKSEKADITQVEFMEAVFSDFLESDKGADYVFDSGNVNKWLKGLEKQSPLLIEYYSENGNEESLSIDIQNNVFPLLYDREKAVEELYNLLMNDCKLSEKLRREISKGYPYGDDEEEAANFVGRVVYLGLERNILLVDKKTKQPLSYGSVSPCVSDYMVSYAVPKACGHFTGREKELKELHAMLEKEDKIFIQGVAGIGKSEFVKKYAALYKKSYSDIIYLTYNDNLKSMLAHKEFKEDKENESEDVKFNRHNLFLKSLKEDVLIIIDNFNTIPAEEPLFDEIMDEYSCKIIFTTRSCFEDYACYELKELPQEELLKVADKLYKGADENKSVIKKIIKKVHSHTLCVELALKILSKHNVAPGDLLDKLNEAYTILNTEHRVNIKKDGKTSKATYYEHIHRLISLLELPEDEKYVLQNMIFMPLEGINTSLFADWTGITTLNAVNDLAECGLIQEDEDGNIKMHPLIREIAVDDTEPSVNGCLHLIKTLTELSCAHGTEYPYHNTMFKVTENIIEYAEIDNLADYKSFLYEMFSYMDKYIYSSGMEAIIEELEFLFEEQYSDLIDEAEEEDPDYINPEIYVGRVYEGEDAVFNIDCIEDKSVENTEIVSETSNSVAKAETDKQSVGDNDESSESEDVLVSYANDIALFLNCIITYEYRCNDDVDAALEYRDDISEICESIKSVNPQLAANLYNNLSVLYMEKIDEYEVAGEYAAYWAEKAYEIYYYAGLDFMHDRVTQGINYATLLAELKEIDNAFMLLQSLKKDIGIYNPYSLDYADVCWKLGYIFLSRNDEKGADMNFNPAMKIYNDKYKEEPEILKNKYKELNLIKMIYTTKKQQSEPKPKS